MLGQVLLGHRLAQHGIKTAHGAHWSAMERRIDSSKRGTR